MIIQPAPYPQTLRDSRSRDLQNFFQRFSHSHSVEEICRHFGVNPIMIFAESKNTTYASAEQMFLAHVVHTLAPTYRRLEQSIDANLLTEADRADGLYSCFVDAGLLRGSITNQKDVILGYTNGGIMTPNEGRRLLDMNPDADPASDKLRIPANIAGKQEEAADKEVMMVNERRAAGGLPPLEGGDAVYMPSSLIPAIEVEK